VFQTSLLHSESLITEVCALASDVEGASQRKK